MTQDEFFETLKNIDKKDLEKNSVFITTYKLLKNFANYETQETKTDRVTTDGELYGNKEWLVSNYCDILSKILTTVKNNS